MEHKKTLFSRREFIKTGTLSLLGIIASPVIGKLKNYQEQYGRVLEPIVYAYQKPTSQSKKVYSYIRDDIVSLTNIAISDDGGFYNKTWYEINNSGYIHSSSIQPVRYQINPVITVIPETGLLSIVTVPFTDTYRGPGIHFLRSYRLYFDSTYWITHAVTNQEGETWYRIVDDEYMVSFYAFANHLKILSPGDISPLSPEIPPEQKTISVNIADKIMIAYENNKPVFMARVSTGGKSRIGRNLTPIGKYKISHKKASRHMVNGITESGGYDYNGVPWVSYFTDNGIAFHGVYWHNNFGDINSHGCINLSTEAAKWVFRWSTPNFSYYGQDVDIKETIGTTVDIFA